MHATKDGFELLFTLPVDPKSAGDPASYAMQSHTYLYHSAYGSEEIQKQDLTIRSATVSENGRRVRLVIDGLRELFVHALEADGVRSKEGIPLLHPDAYYTLNKRPEH